MPFIDEPFVKIDYEEASQSVVADWRGPIGRGPGYRSALDRSLELVKARGAKRWLGNMLESTGVMSPEDSSWLVNDWFPRLLATGAKRFAVVIPPQALAAMQLNRLKRDIDAEKESPDVFQNRYFDNLAEARAWLAKL
jgi:hypothetical protein